MKQVLKSVTNLRPYKNYNKIDFPQAYLFQGMGASRVASLNSYDTQEKLIDPVQSYVDQMEVMILRQSVIMS